MWMIVSAQNTVDDLNIIWGHADAICVRDFGIKIQRQV